MKVVVPDDLDGARADRAIAVLCEVSRSVARKTIDAGAATRAETPLRPADPVSAGDELTVSVAAEAAELAPDDRVSFAVAYEDDAVLVVDKPAALIVHPGAGTASGTLANGLLARYPWAAELGPDRRWGIVHRLDRDTSGLLIVATNPESYAALQQALRDRTVTRRYLALATGRFDSTTGTIEAPIGRDPANPTRMAVTGAGRPARTHYRVLARWEDPPLTLLSIELETGRTHQSRVHLQAIEHPIVGDAVYRATVAVEADPGRTWLHATELLFPHPSGSGDVSVASALPADLAASLERLGPPSSGSVPG